MPWRLLRKRRKQEVMSSLFRPSCAKQIQSCPVSLVHIDLQIAVKQAFILTLWNHLINQSTDFFGFVPCMRRVSGMIKTLRVYKERLRETGAGFS